MYYSISAASHLGCVRANNEDAVAVSRGPINVRPTEWRARQRRRCWVAVADGIGGSAAGELASELVVRMFGNIADRLLSAEDVRMSIVAMHHELGAAAERYPAAKGMGTTFAAAIIRENKALLVNFGDSRIYLQSDSKFVQVSVDHNDGTYLTGYLGGQSPAYENPHICAQAIAEGESILLCTDGLTNLVADAEISTRLTDNLDNPAKGLVDDALRAGGIDNITVAVIRREEEL